MRNKEVLLLHQRKGDELDIPKSGIVYSSYDAFLTAFPKPKAEMLAKYNFILDEFDSLLFKSDEF